jgi:hypothetical protein
MSGGFPQNLGSAADAAAVFARPFQRGGRSFRESAKGGQRRQPGEKKKTSPRLRRRVGSRRHEVAAELHWASWQTSWLYSWPELAAQLTH